MANYANLKAAVNAAITTNGNNEITGAILNDILNSIISTIGGNYTFAGVVTPSTTISAPDANVVWIGGAGTYTQFGGTITINDGNIGIFTYNGSFTRKELQVANSLLSSLLSSIVYSTCPTTSYVATKLCSISGYKLEIGGSVKIKFSSYNQAFNPTLNINSTGAIPLYYNGAVASPKNTWASGDVLNIYYDGTNYYATPLTPSAISHRFYAHIGIEAYEACILDLWLDASLLDASIMRIGFRSFGTNYYLRAYNGQANSSVLWTIQGSLTNVSNGDLVEFKTTIDSVEKTIGYIIFNDIDTFRTNVTSNQTDILNLIYVCSSIKEHPFIYNRLQGVAEDSIDTINIKDNAVTTGKIANNSITADKVQDYCLPIDKLEDKYVIGLSGYDIRGVLQELYIIPSAVIEGYDQFIVKHYGSRFYVRTRGNNSSTIYGFDSYIDFQDKENGVIYELKVTTQGQNTSLNVGDTVGYVIFRDIEAIISMAGYGANNANGITENIINVSKSPCIFSHINKAEPVEPVVGYDYPELQVPSDIYIVAGDELRVYFRSILHSANPDKYDVRAISDVGRSYPKYYWLKTNDIGTYNVAFGLFDESNTQVKSAGTIVHVINPMSQPLTNKNVLVFGASATANGNIAGELRRRLTTDTGDGTSQNPTGLNLGNITFVGRKTGTLVTDIHQEATGGWSWHDYAGEGRVAYRFFVNGVTNLNINDKYTQNTLEFTIVEINVTNGTGEIRCTYTGTGTPAASGTLTRSTGTGDSTITYSSCSSESYNPFWNPNKSGGAGLDFQNYANLYCNGSIDVIISHCGINDMSGYTPDTMENLFTNYVKTVVRAYHSDFPNGKFIISTLPLPSPTGGMGANYGASGTWNYKVISDKFLKFAELAHSMAEEIEFSSYVSIADDVPVFDAEHSYPSEQAVVNTRSTVTAERGTNGVHPLPLGSYQVADAIYAIFNTL